MYEIIIYLLKILELLLNYYSATSFSPITLVGFIFINSSPSELFLLPYSSALSLPIYLAAIILAHLKISIGLLLIISATPAIVTNEKRGTWLSTHKLTRLSRRIFCAFMDLLPVLNMILSSSSRVNHIRTTCGVPFLLLIVPSFPVNVPCKRKFLISSLDILALIILLVK